MPIKVALEVQAFRRVIGGHASNDDGLGRHALQQRRPRSRWPRALRACHATDANNVATAVISKQYFRTRPANDSKRCLAADPAARPDSAAAIVTEWTDYLESGQRRAEQELVRFFDLSLDLFGIAGLNGYFRRINENFPRLLGYSADELKSRPFMDFVHPDDREKTTNEIGRLARGESTIQFVNRYRHVDGHYIWLEWNARSEPDEAAIYAVARDITDRVTAAENHRRLQTSLEKSRQELVDFTENANVAMHWVDADGRIVWANQAEIDFLGYTRSEYIGSPITRYHADPDAIAEILAQLKHGDCLVGREARLVAKDGSIKHVAIHSSVYAEGDRFGHSR